MVRVFSVDAPKPRKDSSRKKVNELWMFSQALRPYLRFAGVGEAVTGGVSLTVRQASYVSDTAQPLVNKLNAIETVPKEILIFDPASKVLLRRWVTQNFAIACIKFRKAIRRGWIAARKKRNRLVALRE